jgi:protein-L-isoaspartate(D-aspartate) O-methyltransferase
MYHAGFVGGKCRAPLTPVFAAFGSMSRRRRDLAPAELIGYCPPVVSLDPFFMTDSTLQRINMVESQVRTSDVTDRRIIKAMLEVPRETFVPASRASMAYMDEAVPVGAANGTAARYLMAPRTFAKLVQLAEVGPDAAVLDIGCATGYSTAVLAKLAKRIVAVECDKALAAQARQLLEQAGVVNAVVVDGALAAGAPGEGPFDSIILNGAIAMIKPQLLEQLKQGGRLAAVVAEGPVCRASVWRRVGKSFDVLPAFEAGAAALPGFETPAGFVF